MKIFIEMLEAITMWTLRKNLIDTLDKAFLTIGKECQSAPVEEGWTIRLHNLMHILKEPELIFIVLSIDNDERNGKETTISICSSGSKQNALVFVL